MTSLEARVALTPVGLFELSVVRAALTHLPVPVALFVDARVAYATVSAGVVAGAPASGWALAAATSGQDVRDGFVLVRLDGARRIRLRGHITPLYGDERVDGVLMAIDDAHVENGGIRHAPSEGDGALAALTPRESEVFRLIARGARTRDVSARLGIAPKTVETHRTAIHRKLGLTCLADVMRLASTLRDDPSFALPAGEATPR